MRRSRVHGWMGINWRFARKTSTQIELREIHLAKSKTELFQSDKRAKRTESARARGDSNMIWWKSRFAFAFLVQVQPEQLEMERCKTKKNITFNERFYCSQFAFSLPKSHCENETNERTRKKNENKSKAKKECVCVRVCGHQDEPKTRISGTKKIEETQYAARATSKQSEAHAQRAKEKHRSAANIIRMLYDLALVPAAAAYLQISFEAGAAFVYANDRARILFSPCLEYTHSVFDLYMFIISISISLSAPMLLQALALFPSLILL